MSLQTLKKIAPSIDYDRLLTDPVAELERHGLEIDESVRPVLERIQTQELDEDQRRRIAEDLRQKLTMLSNPESTQTPQERRAMYKKYAARYREILGWEGSPQDSPGW